MSRFRVSRRAQSDLDEIWRYVAVRDLKAADDLIDEITADSNPQRPLPARCG